MVGELLARLLMVQFTINEGMSDDDAPFVSVNLR